MSRIFQCPIPGGHMYYLDDPDVSGLTPGWTANVYLPGPNCGPVAGFVHNSLITPASVCRICKRATTHICFASSVDPSRRMSIYGSVSDQELWQKAGYHWVKDGQQSRLGNAYALQGMPDLGIKDPLGLATRTQTPTAVYGHNCHRCNSRNDYAAANQPNGTYLCFECR